MPSAAPVPLPTPPVTSTPAPSTHTTMDPYSLPQATGVYVEKKRRGVAPPPLQMPAEAQQGVPSPMMAPQGVVPSPQMPQQYHAPHEYGVPTGYQYSMGMPQHPQAMHSPHGMAVRPMGHPQVGTPMTPMTPMVMTPMSGPHQTGFEGCPPQHVQSYQMGMGPMTPMSPMTSMSFLSDSSTHTMPQHQQMMGMTSNVPGPLLPMQYGVPPQQSGYEMHAHSPMSPTLSTMSGQSSPTYAQAYPVSHDQMGYQMQPQMQQMGYQTAPQAGYTYEGYPMEAGVPMMGADGEMWDGSDINNARRLRRPRQTKDANQAVDAMRYKTKMCRNWELTNRCPYGPRCLFAHGRCELRTTQVNTEAIQAAARSPSPQRAFYENGRFPDFVPVPVELMAQMANGSVNVPSNEIAMATQMA